MKKLVLAGCVFTCAVSVFAQGTIVFNNRVTGSIVSPVYGVDQANPGLVQSGNTASGFPAGTTVYGGALLLGTGFTAQLWGLKTTGTTIQPADSLQPASGYGMAGFRTTTAGAGFWTGSTDPATINGTAVGDVATLQVRAWDNQSGAITTWAAALAAGTALGSSALFNSQPLGGGAVTPPNLVGLVSFNLTGGVIPEPSTFALAGLGAVALLIFRRRK
jgi:hypothetical protein